jgi:hypothetical protein
VDMKTALLDTEQFAWSGDRGALVIEADSAEPDVYLVVAGLPDGDPELLLEQWLTAVFYAVPDAVVEDADIVEPDLWEEGPEWAVSLRLALPPVPSDS